MYTNVTHLPRHFSPVFPEKSGGAKIDKFPSLCYNFYNSIFKGVVVMNEKYHDYFEVGKSKDLIEKHALTEEDLLVFEKLKVHEIQEHKRGCIVMTIFFAIIVLIALFSDIISGIILL